MVARFLAKSDLCRGGVSPPVCRAKCLACGRPMVAPTVSKVQSPNGERSSLPPARNFILHPGGAPPEPPLCKGRCREKRGGGVVPDTNYLLRSANSTLLQSLRRCRASPLYTRGPFWSCEHCKKFSVGGHSICPRCKKFNFNNAAGASPALRGAKCRVQTAGGETPPLRKLEFSQYGGRPMVARLSAKSDFYRESLSPAKKIPTRRVSPPGGWFRQSYSYSFAIFLRRS